MPVPKKRNALEEAEWEEEGSDDTALEREMLLQCMSLLLFGVVSLINSSHGYATCVSASNHFTRAVWDGPGLRWCSRLASSGGFPCAKP